MSWPPDTELYKRSLQVTPGGVHSPVRSYKSVGGTPHFFIKGRGSRIIDTQGRTFLDYCQSFGPLILGHRDPDVQSEIELAMLDVWTLGACEPYSLKLAEWICNKISFVENLRFVNSGTEAVMSALRVARAATGKNKVLKFNGCYHGHVDSLLVKAGSGLAGLAASDSAGVAQSVAENTLVCDLDNEDNFDRLLNQYSEDLAAVIIEPIPANYGLLIQRQEYLHHLVDQARSRGILVIFDEVISGFRVATGGMASVVGIEPDLVTYGKIIGGGFPVGCYGGRKDLMKLVAPTGPVYQAGTLSANPIGMRAGLATLRKLDEDNVHEKLEAKGQYFQSGFKNLCMGRKYPLQMIRMGSLFWIHPQTGEPIRKPEQISPELVEFFKRYFHAMKDNGIYFAPNAYEVGFLSTAHSRNDLDQTLEAMDKALHSIFND